MACGDHLALEPGVAFKIQARGRERGVSVDVYLPELIGQKELIPKQAMGSIHKSEGACCESGHLVTFPITRKTRSELIRSSCRFY
jgi:hypothetical protein